ncbi:MAG: HEAT repeat domain-containing protein [Planctomycetes bacterium]|nr:HEAT repeat domain-containing protein [Planctomycetota bacterium]
MRTLTIAALLYLLTHGVTPQTIAAPPQPPPEFAQSQSPTKPEPFPIKMVDQGEFNPALKGYFLPEGFRAEVVISDPDTINPVGMTFGPDGTLYIMEWRPDPVTGDRWFEVKETFRYKDGTSRQVATMKKFTTDLVKQYKPNVAGRFDPPKVIIAEELPSTIMYHEGWLYVTGRGTVRRWRQNVQATTGAGAPSRPVNPDDPWSLRETIAQGFCGFHHHQVSGLTIGNDGLLYITSGDDDNYAEGSDGSRATVLRTGAVFRCKPDGSNMETFSLGYRNPYRDLAYDDKFNWFHVDNDNEDGSRFQGCRLMHVAEGTDFGWRLLMGARCCRPDHTRGAVAGELPGKVPPMLKTGRGSPAGLLIYNDTRIPEQYQGLLYYPDVYRKLIRAYKVAPDGATFKVTGEFEFMKSNDPLFRPCQMVTGPDGAIYVCDWRTDSGGAGKLSGDGKNGRIYRITWAGTKDIPALPRRGMDSWAKIKALPDDKLVDALSLPDMTDRVEARKELVRRGEKSRDLVLKKFLSGAMEVDAKLPALGVLLAHWNADVEDICRLLSSNDASPDVRRAAIDGLGMHSKPKDGRVVETLVKAIGDREPPVRRAAAMALGRVGGDAAPGTLINGLHADHDGDLFLKDGYLRALERLGKPGIDALLSLAASGDKERDQAVEAFLTLRTKAAAEALPELLLRPDLTIPQRESLIRSFTNYQFDPPISLDPLADFLTRRPNEPASVVQAAVEVFAANGQNNPKAVAFVLALLTKPDEATRLVAIKAIEDTRMASAAPGLLELLGDEKKSEMERIAAVKALRVLGDKRAVDPIKALLTGEHPSTVKAEALRSLAALDINVARATAEKLLDQPDPTLLNEAVIVLATTKPGAKLIAERFIAKKLPRDFFPQVTEALKKFNEDPVIVKLQTEVLRGGLLLSLEPGQIEKVRKLVEKGDAKKGRDLYLNTKVLACATCHRLEGVGGSVGPDLTRVWDTMTIEKILESIVDPSKEIKEGFQTYRLTTIDDQVHTGLKIKEDAKEVLLRDANGRDIRVAKPDIGSLAPSKVSLMPDNVVSQLTYEQFIDLLAFLKSRKEQEALRGLVLEAGVVGGFAADMKAAKPEVKAETTWKQIFADPNGKLDLSPMLPKAADAVYLRAYVFSEKKQSATGTLSTAGAARMWLNDVGIVDPVPASSNGPAETPFNADLKPGWNVLLVKVANAGKPATLSLRLTGDGLRTAGSPAELPPVVGRGK